MAVSNLLYPFRNKLKRFMGGRDKLYPYLEYRTADSVILWEDDFIGGIDVATYRYGSITNGTSAAITGSVASTTNGICRLTTGTTDDGYAAIFPNYGASLKGACALGNNSPVIWARIKVSAITTVKIEVGFTDADDDTGAVLALATPTVTADDCAVWCFDTDDSGGGTYWQGVFAAAATPGTKVEPAVATVTPVAAQYEWLGVAILGDKVKFMHADQYGNPDYESAWQASAITATDALVPWIFVQSRAGSASRTLDIDYVLCYQRRMSSDDG